MDLVSVIRTIPDYPKPGILFRDVTTLMGDGPAFRHAIDLMVERLRPLNASKIAGIEARGFILGGAIAHQLGVGFIPLRKRGKLPHKTHTVEYALEYGVDVMEMHIDAATPGERVVLIDDLIATGGTACAGADLLRRGGAEVIAAAFLVDLPDLGGADRLAAIGVPVHALLAFPGH